MGTEVAIQQLSGAPVDKQTSLCMQFAADQGWQVKTIVPPGGADEAVHLVREGYVELVLMPFVDREAMAIERRVNDAGGKVAYCRQSVGRYVIDADTSGVVVYHHRHGHAADEIARFMRVSVDRVRRALRRRGL